MRAESQHDVDKFRIKGIGETRKHKGFQFQQNPNLKDFHVIFWNIRCNRDDENAIDTRVFETALAAVRFIVAIESIAG